MVAATTYVKVKGTSSQVVRLIRLYFKLSLVSNMRSLIQTWIIHDTVGAGVGANVGRLVGGLVGASSDSQSIGRSS
jgi:hypothetical protein